MVVGLGESGGGGLGGGLVCLGGVEGEEEVGNGEGEGEGEVVGDVEGEMHEVKGYVCTYNLFR